MPAGSGYSVGGRYRLDRVIARGGMGAVWSAHDEELDRPVAVKVIGIDVEGSEGGADRFRREARLAAKLRSPHVVEIFDYGVDPEIGTYLVQELLEGRDLAQRLRAAELVDLDEAVVIVSHVAKALAAAHESGIVHRDLKPANVFLSTYESEIFVKVLDFGVAKARESESTKTGELLGTLHYMSPEQTRGARNAEARSDLWSLGVIAFEMVTGQRPFSGKGPAELVAAVRAAKVPAVRSLRPELPAALDGFFARALAVDLDKRFPTAAELAAAFKQAAGAEAAVAGPAAGVAAPPAPPATRSSDAHWWAAFGGVAATILLGFCSLTTRGGGAPPVETARTADAVPDSAPPAQRPTSGLPPGVRGPDAVRSDAPRDDDAERALTAEEQKDVLLPKVYEKRATRAEVEALVALCGDMGDADCQKKAAQILAGMR